MGSSARHTPGWHGPPIPTGRVVRVAALYDEFAYELRQKMGC